MTDGCLPLCPDAEAKVKANLRTSAAGGRATLIAIGTFTEGQWHDINVVRRGLGLHEIESREIVFIGRHFHTSRAKDGYTVDDMWAQIEAALPAPGARGGKPGLGKKTDVFLPGQISPPAPRVMLEPPCYGRSHATKKCRSLVEAIKGVMIQGEYAWSGYCRTKSALQGRPLILFPTPLAASNRASIW